MPSGFMAVRVGRNSEASAQKFRSVAAAVDPSLLIDDLQPLHDIGNEELRADRAFALVTALGIYFIVFLSAAVTCPLVHGFTTNARDRHSQGAGRGPASGPDLGVLSGVRSARTRCRIGCLASFAAFSRIPDSHVAEPGLIAAVIAFMLLIGLFSCGAPALRALRIEPTVAMREDL